MGGWMVGWLAFAWLVRMHILFLMSLILALSLGFTLVRFSRLREGFLGVLGEQ